MMEIDISELLKKVGNELNIDGTEPLDFKQDSLIFAGPVSVKAHLVNAGETVLLNGSIKAKVKLECCRCLKGFDLPMNIEIEEEYGKKASKAHKAAKNEEIELSDKDFIFPISDDNTIDLTEAVRQNIFTALPIKPLCNKACKGLGKESKKKRTPDPRLSKLKDIKGKIQGGYHAST
ncbi:DUF177 domain-containing protein [Candidatus Margulisiibacteriota bacterium]